MELHLEQSQKQILSQQMIQSVQILQMTTQELTEYMKQEVLDNPVLELERTEPEERGEERLRKLEWLAGLDEQNRSSYRYDREDAEENNGLNNLSAKPAERLEDYLRAQLLGAGYGEKELEIFDYVIQCLDARGYYTESEDALAEQLEISKEEAEKALKILRDLEPFGVCARDLRSCLLKQIEKRADCGETEEKIVSGYLELLGKNQLPLIAQKLKLSLETVARAAERIRTLNPKPAQGFDNGELFRYVVPDVTVVKFKERFEILLNDYACPVLRIRSDYREMLESDCGEDVKTYLEERLRHAERLQDCIQRRNTTLLSLMETILAEQKVFFLTGKKELRPFRIQEAAKRMGVHESTVSRALHGKYVQCCWGIYPLSFFFPKGIGKYADRQEIAADKVKKEIQILVSQENPKSPYSDQYLAELLEERGIKISRRTVAKYREDMGIKNARERKLFL